MDEIRLGYRIIAKFRNLFSSSAAEYEGEGETLERAIGDVINTALESLCKPKEWRIHAIELYEIKRME